MLNIIKVVKLLINEKKEKKNIKNLFDQILVKILKYQERQEFFLVLLILSLILK